MTHILPIRTGWTPTPGQVAMYPEDLPYDWRLSYFANESLGVLVPAATWRGADEAELEVWREDTVRRFRFYLEIPPGAGDASRVVAEALGERFGGLVGEAGDLDAGWLGDDQRWVLVGPGAALSLPGAGSTGLAVPCPPELVGDLKGARRWIETLTGPLPAVWAPPRRSVLCLLGPCGLDDLRRWQGLVELMGLSF